jgi:hypothetical protein
MREAENAAISDQYLARIRAIRKSLGDQRKVKRLTRNDYRQEALSLESARILNSTIHAYIPDTVKTACCGYCGGCDWHLDYCIARDLAAREAEEKGRMEVL